MNIKPRIINQQYNRYKIEDNKKIANIGNEKQQIPAMKKIAIKQWAKELNDNRKLLFFLAYNKVLIKK